jgi:AraC family transcriptional regulator
VVAVSPALLEQPISEPSHRRAVERVIEAMSAHLDEGLSLESLAARAFFSPYHFHRMFRAVTGVPPGRFVTALRLEAAKRLLLTSDLSVTEICLTVGYQSLGTFTSQFSRLVGASPQRLREISRHSDDLDSLFDSGEVEASAVQSVHGTLTLEDEEFRGVAAIGLFPTPLAQGRPAGCTVAKVPGPYEIVSEHEGSFYVLAVAMPSASGLEALLDDGRALVATSSEPVSVVASARPCRVDLRLRRRRRTDPPIPLAPALLLVSRKTPFHTRANGRVFA